MQNARAMPQLNLRVPESLKDWLKEKAESNHRSLNGEIIFIFEQYKLMEKEQKPKNCLTKNEKINDSLELSRWKTIDSAPKDTPLLLIANGVVQNVTYALCATEKRWYTVQDQELIDDDDDFVPTHWQRLPTQLKA